MIRFQINFLKRIRDLYEGFNPSLVNYRVENQVDKQSDKSLQICLTRYYLCWFWSDFQSFWSQIRLTDANQLVSLLITKVEFSHQDGLIFAGICLENLRHSQKVVRIAAMPKHWWSWLSFLAYFLIHEIVCTTKNLLMSLLPTGFSSKGCVDFTHSAHTWCPCHRRVIAEQLASFP